VFHTYLLPSVLVVVAVVTGSKATSSVGIVWLAHIVMDRGLGYGLKYAENFKHTHLGVLRWSGRRRDMRSSRCRSPGGSGRREPPAFPGGLPRNAFCEAIPRACNQGQERLMLFVTSVTVMSLNTTVIGGLHSGWNSAHPWIV
jgi:hypothetical protein